MLSRRALLTLATSAAGSAMLPPLASAESKQPFFKRLNLPIGLELYTVAKEATADLDGTLARIADVGYKEVEVASFYGHNAAQMRAACDQHSLTCRSMHAQGQATRAPEDASFTDMPKLVDEAKTLGVEYVVLPMLPLRLDFKSSSMTMQTFMDAVRGVTEDDWKSCAAFLNEKAEQLARAGLKLSYHNHNIEFAPIGATTPYEILMKETHASLVTFELDVGWVASGRTGPDHAPESIQGSLPAAACERPQGVDQDQLHNPDGSGRHRSRDARLGRSCCRPLMTPAYATSSSSRSPLIPPAA